MNHDTRTRFDNLWEHLIRPKIDFNQSKMQPVSKTTLSVQDLYKLVECGIISKVDEKKMKDSPTRGSIVPFTTVEQREDGFRRRFICWPSDHNAALQYDYTPKVPISQPVSYVDALRHQQALKRDLKCSFFQVQLPPNARSYYRFAYQDRVYELNRMPMGHVCAPEIQQTITSVLAGDVAYMETLQ